MRSTMFATAECAGNEVRYYILSEELDNGTEDYGVLAAYRGETADVCGVTMCRTEIEDLMGCLRRGGVTPTALRDVVEDWLLR